MTEQTLPIPTLDHNEQIPVTIGLIGTQSDEDKSNLRLALDTRKLESPYSNLIDKGQHFRKEVKIVVDGKPVTAHTVDDKSGKRLFYDVEVNQNSKHLTVMLYGQPVAAFSFSNGEWIGDPAHVYSKLSATELRILATSEVGPPGVPASRSLFNGFDPKKHAPVTDLHTHFVAQIVGDRLMEIALEHHIDYPIELLREVGIKESDLSESERAAIKPKGGRGYNFSALKDEGLACEKQNELCDVIPIEALSKEHRDRLQYQWNIPQDVTMVFADFDRQYYRFVNPLSKNPDLTHDLVHEIGRVYHDQGVRYAEITASLLHRDPSGNLRLFEETIKATREVEKEYGVKLRYLIGIPRTNTNKDIRDELEQVKYAARHPFIAGVDFLGHESNETSDFLGPLASIAQWVKNPQAKLRTNGWNFLRDFTIRVHAGETDKNTGNVADAVGIAEKYGVHVRVAHALNERTDHELDEKITRLSSTKPPLLSMEFCPDSNIAYNNIQFLDEMPLKRWLRCCQSWFLATDGGGAVQTSPVQLALSALATGMISLVDLLDLRKREERYIDERDKAYAEKSRAFEDEYANAGKYQGANADERFLQGLSKHIQKVKTRATEQKPYAPNLPEEFKNKMPILIAGAATDAWNEEGKDTQNEMRACMRMLVATVDPTKAYFVIGRSKRQGVTAELDKAVLDYNQDPANHEKFQVVALNTDNVSDRAESVTEVIEQPGDREQAAENIIKFMSRSLAHSGKEGICLFFGGKGYTNNMLKVLSTMPNLNCLMMDSAHGASASWAKKTDPSRLFSKWQNLIPRMAETLRERMNKQEAFRDHIDPYDHDSLNQIFVGLKMRSFQERTAGGGGRETTKRA